MAGAETGTGAPVALSGAGGTPWPGRMGSSTSRRVTRRKTGMLVSSPSHRSYRGTCCDMTHRNSLRQGFKDEPDNS